MLDCLVRVTQMHIDRLARFCFNFNKQLRRQAAKSLSVWTRLAAQWAAVRYNNTLCHLSPWCQG